MSETVIKAREAVEEIRSKHKARPAVGIILGSGLGPLADIVAPKISIPYTDIPHFPVPTVEGHAGNLVMGPLGGVEAAVMQGRFHYYEGYFMRDVTFPVRVLAGLGAGTLIITNASGAVDESLDPGDFLVITDHINLMGANPLVGLRHDAEGRDRFVDLSAAYDARLAGAALDAAAEAGVTLKEGVLAAMSGPSYETPAEIDMLRALGAHAVCMSTVPEVIMARYMGIKVLGLSLITNKAASASEEGPAHSEVLDMAGRRHGDFIALVLGSIRRADAAGLL